MYHLMATLVPYNHYSFRVLRVTQGDGGVWSCDGAAVDLERCAAWPGLRYKTLSGIRSRGQQSGVYAERWAESDRAAVWVGGAASHGESEVTLNVAFFDNGGASAVGAQYEAFCEWIEGCMVLWWDSLRQRKALLYLSDKTSPASDVVKPGGYIEASFKFKSAYGRSFGLDDVTIEKDYGLNGGVSLTSEAL